MAFSFPPGCPAFGATKSRALLQAADWHPNQGVIVGAIAGEAAGFGAWAELIAFMTEEWSWNVAATSARLRTPMPRKQRPPPAPKQPDPPPGKPAAGLQEQPGFFDLLEAFWGDQTDQAPLPAPSKARRPKPR